MHKDWTENEVFFKKKNKSLNGKRNILKDCQKAWRTIAEDHLMWGWLKI